jgi:hypothetical protein
MEEFAWSILAVPVVISAIGGWVGSSAIQRRWRQQQGDQGLSLISREAWGEPDLDLPSVSPHAGAEVADLEALWSLPSHRASSGPTEA